MAGRLYDIHGGIYRLRMGGRDTPGHDGECMCGAILGLP
jgi:hypothetical protein